MRSPLLRRLTPFLVAACFFAVMTALYLLDLRGPYMTVIRRWGINPWFSPFLDTDTILSAVRCRQAGIDVYVLNPCDPLGRVYDYSPLWLAIARVPGIGRGIVPFGLATDLGFLLALLLLPAGRRWADSATIAVGAISSASLFAVERGNNDLVIFALAAAAAALSCASRRLRLAGYGAALLAGLLKYYPMTLLALAVREPPRRFAAIAAAAIGAVALFVLIDGAELARALALIPTGAFISDMFGSSTLSGGLFKLFAITDEPARRAIHAAMTIAALGGAAWWGSRATVQADVALLDERERAFLLAGAMLVLGCFFTAQNIGYRAVHLVLVLPSLTALRGVSGGRRRYVNAIVATVLLLWAEGWRALVRVATRHQPSDRAALCKFGAWLFRETLWWWTIVLLGSLAVAVVLRSEIGGATMRKLRLAPRGRITVRRLLPA